MIIFVRQATVTPGKTSEAEELCKRIASYDKKQPEVEDSILMRPLQGQQARLMVATRLSSLAAWEEYRKKRKENPEWQALQKEAGEKRYWDPNTLEHYQYEVIE